MNITAKYITHIYPDGTYGLDDFSAEIKSGDFVTVLGESGCGKTTLLRVLAGLEKPCAGELYFDGVLFSDVPLKSRRTSMVFQEYLLYPKFTVWENIRTALDRYGLEPAEETKRIKKALRDFGLTDVAGQLPRFLSGGQQQRVALAKAVVTEPELLLFDEPLSNVAEAQRAEYMDIIRALKTRLPATTFVYVTHNVREALTLGNKLLVMGDGRALQYGDTMHVADYPHTIDVLRQIYETYERPATISGGKAIAEGVAEISVDAPDGEATIAAVPFDDRVFLFDAKGDSLAPDPLLLRLPAVYDGRELRVCGVKANTDGDFPYRFTGELDKELTAILPASALSSTPSDGSTALPVSALGEKTDEIGITASADGNVYFDVNGAELVGANGERVLAHYRLYEACCEGRVRNNTLLLPCGAMPFRGSNGKVRVRVKRGATARIQKKHGLKMQCLAEEIRGEYRLAYIRLAGFDNYVTVRLDKDARAFSKKARVAIDPSGIEQDREK